MWTIKITLLAAGIAVTAFSANSADYQAHCIAAHQAAGDMAAVSHSEVAAGDTRRDCPAGE